MSLSDFARTIDEIVALAHNTILTNQDVFVAQYILQNPDVKMEDVVLCYQPDIDGGVQFYIKRKK